MPKSVLCILFDNKYEREREKKEGKETEKRWKFRKRVTETD